VGRRGGEGPWCAQGGVGGRGVVVGEMEVERDGGGVRKQGEEDEGYACYGEVEVQAALSRRHGWRCKRARRVAL
jgi:hypothetical protein